MPAFQAKVQFALALALCVLAAGQARADDRADFRRAPLPEAVRQLAQHYGVSVGAANGIPPIITRPVHHARDAGSALSQMLRGSGLIARQLDNGVWRIEPAPPPTHPPHVTAPPPATVAADDIVVSAVKSGARVGAVSRAIAMLRLAEDDQTLPSAAGGAVARETDGLVLTALGAGNNRMFLRGIADSPLNGSSQSPVAVLLDGGRLTWSAPDPDLRLVDVERVELLKGPQGALYGTGVLGGIYQVVPRRVTLDHVEALVAGGGTVSSRGKPAPSGSAMLNLPIARDVLGLRLVGYGEEQPGWITTGTRVDANRSHVAGGRADLAVAPAANWRIDFEGLAQRIRVDDSQYVYAPGTLTRPDQMAEPHLTEIAHAGAHLDGQIGAVRIEALSGYTWHHVRAVLDASVGGAALASVLGVDAPGQFVDNRQFRLWESELRLSGRIAGAAWLIGASHTWASEQGTRNLSASTTGGGDGGTGGISDAAPLATSTSEDIAVDIAARTVRDTAIFGTISVPITHSLSVEGGARYYSTTLDQQRTTEEIIGAHSATRQAISPSGALTWHPREGRVVFVRYDQAFRQGALSFGEDGRFSTLAGDRLETLEAGWRESSGTFTLNAGVFVTWWNDMQADMLQSTGLIETQTVGRALIKGGEAGLTWHAPGGWQLSLGGTFERARLLENAAGVPQINAHLPIVPDVALRGGLERGFALLGGQGHVRMSLRWIGPARLSFDPQLDQPTGNMLESALAGSLRWGKTCVSLAIDNPLNRASNTFAYGNPFRIVTPMVTPQAPVRATMMLAQRF